MTLPALIPVRRMNVCLDTKVYFAFFLVMNALLAYGTNSLEIKFWGGCLGVLLPLAFLVYLKKNEKSGSKIIGGEETLPPSAGRWIPLLFLAALVSRTAGLTRLSAWPMPDDGIFSYYSAVLSQQWSWQFFFSKAQAPPLFNWCLALYFKFCRPSLFSLWLFPALLSILTFLAGAWGARRYFPRSLALILISMGSMNFWILYTGRFCMPTGLFLFWETLTLALLAHFLRAQPGAARMGWGGLLGVCGGLGFFVNPIWGLLGLMVFLAVGKACLGDPQRSRGVFISFMVPLLFFGLAYLWVSLDEKNGTYLKQILDFGTEIRWEKQWMDSTAYLTALFWGTPWRFFYGPLWGGALNPVSGALFFLGVLECFKGMGSPFIQWIGLGLAFYFLPVFITQNFEFFRVLGAWPFLLLVLALGTQAFLASLPSPTRLTAALLLVGTSSALDLYHLAGPYHRLWGTPSAQWENLKSLEYWKADQILRKTLAEKGPGLLLSDFQTYVTDQTLSVAEYPLDPGLQDGLSLRDKKWVAVLLDAHFKPFLENRFPHGQWFWLGINHMPEGGLAMALLPVDPGNQALLQSWLEADIRMGSVTWKIMNQGLKESEDQVLKKLFEAYPALQGDPFLETCFWEKVLYHEKIKGDGRACWDAIQNGLKRGYLLPPLLNDEGVFLMQRGKWPQAKRAFQRALQSPLNWTPAAANLKRLEQLETTPPSPRLAR